MKKPRRHIDSKVLIVDDDDMIRALMNDFMKTLGYQCYTASSGLEALRILEENPVDVVITDIIMPGMDGLELTRKIKEKYDYEIIVMTGFSGAYSYEEVIQKGASDFVFKPVRYEELHLRLQRVLRERSMREKLQQLAITDDLTRLFNSRHFYRRLSEEMDRAVRYHHPLALLMLDIDYFKAYNDTHGHLEGNTVLTRLGHIIRSGLRRLDSAYRYGGEEFTVILPETDGPGACHVARRLSDAIAGERFYPAAGKAVGITVSIGIAEYRPDEKMEVFIKRADVAMYASKQKGRNCITFLETDPDDTAVRSAG
ncbi:diguanylate cyclase response regulator [Desulfococcus multivorans]|uniref:diguanylate cyclase n=2 Tax=Desulfococcaceae TaxID=2931039 RepID=S7UKB3_DESML|nr:diguanylate cyclase response regulator [Desulfococcus multivorans]EPR34244.1 response regulator receiver modulated diguanylate cyclase [Desulfococcus multivorans DSM 2059]SKA06266.1 diguanylate cyclase (GGDEF) domain-containing protein [Desulfococcus multivorans DSM 2059]